MRLQGFRRCRLIDELSMGRLSLRHSARGAANCGGRNASHDQGLRNRAGARHACRMSAAEIRHVLVGIFWRTQPGLVTERASLPGPAYRRRQRNEPRDRRRRPPSLRAAISEGRDSRGILGHGEVGRAGLHIRGRAPAGAHTFAASPGRAMVRTPSGPRKELIDAVCGLNVVGHGSLPIRKKRGWLSRLWVRCGLATLS